MNEYMIIELENNDKYAIIDTIEYEETIYFLTLEMSNDETIIDNNYAICVYNEIENCFEKLKNDEEYEILKQLFEKKLENQNQKDFLLSNINIDDMLKLKIINIEDSNYTFENINKETITKNINFDKKTPQLNDIVYLPKEIVNEINIFQYGPIYDLNNLNTNEVIKVETKTEEYFLQRYYG